MKIFVTGNIVNIICPDHGFKYRLILIYIGNIVSSFEVPDIRVNNTEMADIGNFDDRYC